MVKRKATEDDFELHKDAILGMYVELGKPLSEVIAAMTRDGFKRTKTQYERALRNWGVSKKISKAQWACIVAQLRVREAQEKQTCIKIHGRVVPQTKIRKQRVLYEYQSTFDRFASLKQASDARATTPPSAELGIELITPAASPSPELQASLLFSKRKMPWESFHCIVAGLHIPKWQPNGLIPVHPKLGNLPFLSLDTLLKGSTASSQQLVQSQSPAVIIGHPVLHDPRPYLPSLNERGSCGLSQAMLGLRHGMTEGDLLKLLIGAISNNFETAMLTPLLIELADHPDFRTSLKYLLDQDLHTTRALAEKLLLPAIRRGSLQLVRTLIESKIEFNICLDDEESGLQISALECAVDEANLEIISYLLDQGAADSKGGLRNTHTSRCSLCGQSSLHDAVITLAITRGRLDVVVKLLDFAAQHPGLFPSITICLLRQAILAGHHHIPELLLDEHPGLLETGKLTPWLLYEAAAASDNTSHVDGMVCALARRGLDITATDELGRGSMLAAASRELNTACIHRLLGAKVPTNSIAAGMKESGGCHQSWWYNYEYRLKGIMGKSALHIAIERGFETLVDLLLRNGADPNQFCDSFPIHLAAWKGNSNIVTSLVKAGANVHNTSHKHKAPIEFEQIGTSLLTLPPIVTALMRGYMDVAEILFDAGGDPLHGVPRQWRSKFQGSFFQVVIKKGSPRLIHNTVKIWKWDAGMAIDCISTSLVRFGQDFADEIQTLIPPCPTI